MRHLKDAFGDCSGLMIVLFCAGMLAVPAAAEEQDGKWVLTDIRYDKNEGLAGDDGCWKEVNSILSTSSSHIVKQNLCGDNDFTDWSSSASWQVPRRLCSRAAVSTFPDILKGIRLMKE